MYRTQMLAEHGAFLRLAIPMRVRRSRNGCWNWMGYRTPRGYGRAEFAGFTQPAHKLSYEVFVGAVPEGLILDHLCRNHACVRPSHLEPVTPKVNRQRGLQGGMVGYRPAD